MSETRIDRPHRLDSCFKSRSSSLEPTPAWTANCPRHQRALESCHGVPRAVPRCWVTGSAVIAAMSIVLSGCGGQFLKQLIIERVGRFVSDRSDEPDRSERRSVQGGHRARTQQVQKRIAGDRGCASAGELPERRAGGGDIPATGGKVGVSADQARDAPSSAAVRRGVQPPEEQGEQGQGGSGGDRLGSADSRCHRRQSRHDQARQRHPECEGGEYDTQQRKSLGATFRPQSGRTLHAPRPPRQ
jgi:hypothetical protein